MKTRGALSAADPRRGHPADKPTSRRGEWMRAMILSISSAALMFPIAAPISWWPLAFVCLVPWSLSVATTRSSPSQHAASVFAGAIYFLVSLRWMEPVTGLGFAALALYLALYWPLAGWAIRSAYRRGVPLTIGLPVAWVACEYLRAIVMSGFPWLFLSHALYGQIAFIQISDIAGAYGVSFVIGMMNGVVADVLVFVRARRSRSVSGFGRRPSGGVLTACVAATVATVAGVLVYGQYRLNESKFVNGPRVAVIQEDFPLVSRPPYGEHVFVVLARYVVLAARAAVERPDIIVFPETMWSATQNHEFLAVEHRAVEELSPATWPFGMASHRIISALARGDYAAVNRAIESLDDSLKDKKLPRIPIDSGPPAIVVVGTMAVEVFPESTEPRVKKYNSTLVYDPDGSQRRERYDKTHLVPFGEAVPFRYSSLHWLYVWLNSLSPFSRGGTIHYSLTPGDALTVFRWSTPNSTRPTSTDPLDVLGTFGTPICYEDVMPYVIRNYVWDGPRRRVDFLLNMSNDGWFLHSAELPQHLAICVFRAVENRVGIARAVNTGISGFISPSGQLYSLVNENGRTVGNRHGIVGYSVDHVLIDRRVSFYGRTGDWFAVGCGLALAAALSDSVVRRVARRVRAAGEAV